jgi:hypothetical protein
MSLGYEEGEWLYWLKVAETLKVLKAFRVSHKF